MNYVVITPVRDEEQYISCTIDSMRGQTLKPLLWIIVDDGSKDQTGRLIDDAAAKNPWIKAIHREDRGSRQAGSGVIAAFYNGFALVPRDGWDYVVKLDGDLSYDPDYFANCLREFEADKKLGIAGGICCKLDNGKRVPEFIGEPSFHVRGPTKIYRRECFEAIGGLIVAPGWDTVDQIKANMLGWKTATFPHIQLIHHRPSGGAYGSWNDGVKNGLANYITGYHPLFMLCKCIRRLFCQPYGSQALGLGWGFLKGYLKRVPQVGDPAAIMYLRDQQWRALTLRSSLWRSGSSNTQSSPVFNQPLN
jgi:biofilm PGA synthesis N-glycosyltransferase PgaC